MPFSHLKTRSRRSKTGLVLDPHDFLRANQPLGSLKKMIAGMRAVAHLSVLAALMVSCGQRVPSAQAGLCICWVQGAFNCSGRNVEICNAGHWEPSRTCKSNEVCVLKQCSGSLCRGATCAAVTTECATTATYDGNSVIANEIAPVPMGKCHEGAATAPPKQQCFPANSPPQKRELVVGPVMCANVKQDFSQLYGVDVYAPPVSSGMYHCTEPTPKGKYGQWFLRGLSLERTAFLWAHSANLGEKMLAGTAVVTEWHYSPELAIGDKCPVTLKPLNEKLMELGIAANICIAGNASCEKCATQEK
jgi:hypothetical protein